MSAEISELSRALHNQQCHGKISAVDYPGRRVRVCVSGRDTDWIDHPGTVGKNYRGWFPLRIGTQVLLGSPSGDLKNAKIIAVLYTDDLPPPSTDGNTDIIVWNDGTTVSYDSAAHKLTVDCVGDIAASAAKTITVTSGSQITVTAATAVTISAPSVSISATNGSQSASVMSGDFEQRGSMRITGNLSIDGNIDIGGNINVDGNGFVAGNLLNGGANSNHHGH